MFGRLLPRETNFYELFEKHAALTLQAAKLFHAFITVNQIALPDGVNLIKELEHEADEITFHCIEALKKSFITPFQQDDIYRLISRMDDIMDSIDEAYDDCITYKILFPTPAAKEFALLLAATVEKVDKMIRSLRDRRKDSIAIHETCRLVNALESQADEILRKAMGQLFDEEHDLRLLIKWKQIYEDLEKAMDFCNDVAKCVEGIMLEYD